ncbi:MAG: hypothetical protein M1817_002816 [Caeruleum heppii]|nr:MAG: hypothetical protein M1817_002816 [Caeruleum heppii]
MARPSLATVPAEIYERINILLPYRSAWSLARTSKHFYALSQVDPPSTFFKAPKDSNIDTLLALRRDLICQLKEELVPPHYEPCFQCRRFRPGDEFDRGQQMTSELDSSRYCLDCGVRANIYYPGQHIRWGYGATEAIRRKLYYCTLCRKIQQAQGCDECGACEECVLLIQTNPTVLFEPDFSGTCGHAEVANTARAMFGVSPDEPIDLESLSWLAG